MVLGCQPQPLMKDFARVVENGQVPPHIHMAVLVAIGIGNGQPEADRLQRGDLLQGNYRRFHC